MKNTARYLIWIMLVVLLLSAFQVGAYGEASPEQDVYELMAEDYAAADSIFDQIEAMEQGPAKRNATQSQLSRAAESIVVQSDSYVAGSVQRNGDVFTWFTTDGVRCIYDPHMRKVQNEMTAPEEPLADGVYNEPKSVKSGFPTGKQVYLIGPYYGYDSSFTGEYKTRAKEIAKAIGDTDGYTLYSGTSATIDKVAQAVENGAVVIFDSHGATDYANPNKSYDFVTGATTSYLCLKTTKGLTDYDYQQCGACYADGDVFVNGYSIAYHMDTENPSGILWMATCFSMATDTIFKPLRDMGVEVAYGYSETITFGGDYLFAQVFWSNFCAGDTMSAAIQKMKDKYGYYDRSPEISEYYGWISISSSVYAQRNYIAFPIVVSDDDAYPGQRTSDSKYGVDSIQTVYSNYKLIDKAITGTVGDGITWSIDSDGNMTVSGTGAMPDYAQPTFMPWKYYKKYIRSVTIEDGVTYVGRNSFNGFKVLQSVSLADSVTEIGPLAFRDCIALSEIDLGKGVSTFQGSIFNGCTALEEIVIPGSLKTCYDAVFANCTSLKKVTVLPGAQTLGSDTFRGCSALEEVSIPDTINEIGSSVFSGCSSLKTVALPNGITAIGMSAFLGCTSLENLLLPDKVTSIGDHAFRNCTSLTNITIPVSVKAIGSNAFYGCSALQTIEIPKNVTAIGTQAFSGCSLLDGIWVDNNNKTFVSDASGCLYTKNKKEFIAAPVSLSGSYVLADSVVTIRDNAFYGCDKLTGVALSRNTTTIGEQAFGYCSGLVSVNIGKSVSTIGKEAFSYCSGLKSVTIPQNVTTIGQGAFCGCSALEEITIPFIGGSKADETSTACFPFGYIFGTTAYTGGVGTYQYFNPNSAIGTTYYLPKTLKKVTVNGATIPYGAFSKCENLETVVFGQNISRIEDRAFYNCYKLSSITLPEGVTYIGSFAFSECRNLQEVTFPKTLETIENSAFYECRLLKKITFAGSAPTIGSRAFSGDTATVYYPKNDDTWTASVRGNYYGKLTWVAYEPEPEIEKFEIDVARMILGNALEFQFGVAQSKLTDTTGVYAVIEKGDVTKTIPATQWGSVGPYYAIVYDGLAAKEMADNISVTIYNADGEAISNAKTDSVRAYVARAFDSQTAEGKTMMVDMLNYGAAAQEKFNYNTDNLANNQLTDTQKACGTATLTATENNQAKGPNFVGTRLVLESRIQMQVAFTGMDRTMYAVYSYTDHNGTARSVTVKGEDFIEVSGMYGIELSELVYADARSLVTVRVYNADGTLYSGAKDSIQSYVNRSGETDPLFNALMKFTDSAKAYLH